MWQDIRLQRQIIILIDSPFSKRDYDRFGIEILQQRFNVTVFDCTPWLKPQVFRQYSDIVYPFSQYNTIHNWTEFERMMAHVSKGLAIDYLGNIGFSNPIYQILRDHEMLRTIIFNGPIPVVHLKKLQRLKLLYWQGEIFRRLSTRLLPKIRSGVNATLPADIAVLSGEACIEDLRAQASHKIWAHSFDYDLYLNLRNRKGTRLKPYAVFIDMDLAYHSDFLYEGTKPPVTAEKYYPSLLAFFEMFERITGIDVIIAAHPRSRYDLRPNLLSGRVPVLGSTAELVRDADAVFSHYSTAVSFAILWRKPIIFLTSKELNRSPYGFHVALYSTLLNAPLVNIDSLNEPNIDLKTWMRFDEYAYSDYQKRYIKTPETPEQPVWEIFSDYVQKIIV